MKAWVQIGSLFCVLLMSGCMVVHDVRLDSVPTGAAVYLVPKVDVELDPSIIDDQGKLANYRVPEGDTPVVTKAREKVYTVLFVRDGQVEMRQLDVLSPPHSNQAKAVFP